MTLDIERERREFEAAHVGANFSRCDIRPGEYANRSVQGRWTTWLLAKRAAVGSAEPVAYRRFLSTPKDGGYWVFGERRYGVTGEEPLFLAPPAPVSAEPIRQRRLKGAQGWEDVLPTDNDCKGSIVGWEYRTVYSAAPSTDSKDSERFDWYFGPDSVKCTDFMKQYFKGMKERWTPDQWRLAIDAAIAAKEAGK